MTRSYKNDSPQASAAAAAGAPGPPSTYDTNVLSRLHALFAPAPSHTSSRSSPRRQSRGELSPGETMDAPAVVEPPEPVVERESIKVKVVTWNMGDSLPKGDLTVLLGEVPTYTGGSPTGGLPILPVEDKHPYHIVVVAAQECPTDSGVPRGLGGGIMKGVSGRVGHRKEKEKEKEKEKWTHDKDGEEKPDKGPAGESVIESVAEKVLPPTPKPFNLDGDEVEPSRVASPSLSSPHTTYSGKGTKGWSTMLDEWFCGAPDRPSDGGLATPVMQDSYSMPDNRDMPSPQPPPIARSASAPGKTIALSDPISIPSGRPTVGPNGRNLASPLARSQSDSDSSGSSQQEAGLSAFLSVPHDHATPLHHKNSDASLRGRPERPGITIPSSPNPAAMGMRGSKCYVHVIKERLMGMYLSIYVYRGCEHLIQGVDKDFVTAGLAGGRVGNKGGIGMSLKLADHRFLFVNSHLAAHTSRQQARLENIEKIKRELHLDTFLPKDDPRLEEKDITDRFDTVFWCGDLNFRTDLSRLHAEWLVEQKKYSEMLMWDQLRNAMKDPATNPFPGFLEADIDFPPTFKYDVWRSLKHTVREQRKSLRRRNTNESRRRPSSLEPSSIPLDHVPEIDPQEEVIAERGEDDEELEPPRRSFESYMQSTTTSAAPSIIGTEADDDSDSDIAPVIGAGAYGSKHRALEVAVKEKTKHLLAIMKLDSVLTPKKKGRRAERVVSTDMTTDFDYGSRRTSVSSLASVRHDRHNEAPLANNEETFSPPSDAHSSADVHGTSFGSSMSGIGLPKRPSRFASLKRSVSGRSVKKGDDEYPLGDEDDMPDIREGKYDTSKKQRVPSWCDRVLWKAHIEPDPLPESQPSAPMSRDRLSRFSQAFVHFGDHFRPSFARTSSIDAAHVDRVRIDRPLPPTPPESHSHTPEPHSPSPLVESPSSTPESPYQSPHGGQGMVPGPKGTKSPLSRGRTSSPIKRHPLLGSPAEANLPGNWSPPARPRITFERASTHDHNHVEHSFTRRRANSDSVPAVSQPRRSSTAGTHATVESPGGSDRSSSPSLASRRGALAPIHWSAGPHSMRTNSKQWRRTRTIEPSAFAPHAPTPVSQDARMEDKSAFSRFMRDLPNWLHSRNSTVVPDPLAGKTDQPPSPAPMPVVPRRRKGEVVCLGYGTIDDVGMRQLEGRSDHRPAIFAAAVYV